MVAGPGKRFVLWMQGCPLRCPGCVNPEFQPFLPRTSLSVDHLARRIPAIRGIEGVTYTGGEPTYQAYPLALLSEQLRRRGLTVVCYTGYTLEALKNRADPAVERLLRATDLLIDGPYVRDKAASLLWRGSSNQRIHFLTDAYRGLRSRVEEAGAEVEFSVGAKRFTAVGNWPPGFLERLADVMGN